ncbi:MAG: S8 family serine peptidase [Devosia sp.]|nr:S8 family serine peptidase [Devosia sp.]
MARSKRLLIKVRGDGATFAASAQALGVDHESLRPILAVPARPPRGSAFAGTDEATWFAVDRRGSGSPNPWDDAHLIVRRGDAFSAAGGPAVLAVEPDFEQAWDYKRPSGGGMAAAGGGFDPQDPTGGKAVVPGRLAWNLDADFSQFADARTRVGAKQDQITVAHLDTGYDKRHSTVPEGLLELQQRNVIPGEPADDATDRAPPSGLANRGHGTATLGILAGNKVPAGAPGWAGFTGFLGAAPGVKVIPVRIADWVVRFSTSTMVEGFNYARLQGVQVLTMSMGGLSSAALVDAVNLAYEAGIVMVAAAGNNFADRPLPQSIVFPARYKRVLAACGVMGDGAAYANLPPGEMQGSYGPPEKMLTALGAYTPNVPWPEIDAPNVIDMNGAGTSSATPQVAAAAALWLAEHWDTVKTYAPWARVEAVRQALFDSAAKFTGKMGRVETLEKIGMGVVLANAALDLQPRAERLLKITPPARDSWSWADLIFGGEISAAAIPPERRQMFVLELTQMAQRVQSIDKAIANPEADPGTIPHSAINRYLEAALDEGNPSRPLRAFLEMRLGRAGIAAEPRVKAPPAAPRIVRTPHPAPPPKRRLRIFALDPTIAKNLDSVSVYEATVSVPWDDVPTTESGLQPGPVGEYLEVVDIDPATQRVYDPVDLNDRALLAQDGLTPSEGNPQFHQQMVYAVAMTTIGHFERALGRRALWASHFDTKTGKNYEVPRLRIYPHALRTENAYYSPDKVALLFGYFQADSSHGDTTSPGSMVFSCLSSDIVAHEMSHALLDGLHRRFQEASNPDVPAFHEAFADIVALFQHFTLKELVRFSIAQTRGDLQAANLLSGLAKQFGEGSGRSGPLREYGTPKMDTLDYDTTFEPHDRGSILVFAVYGAFLKIVARRTADLTRLATGGSGVLPAGALHPGLVEGLADEVVKTAQQMLTICIRALDYCPAVDITFGEYLRAIVTADADAFPDDPMNYRLAFMESFRNWKLIPRNVRTVSTETLSWSGPDPDVMPSSWIRRLIRNIDLGWNQKLNRSRIFALNEDNRWELFDRLKAALKRDPALGAQFGLLSDVPRYRNNGRIQAKVAKGGTTFDVNGVRPTRRVEPDGSFRTEIIAVIQQRVPLRLDGTLMLEGTDGKEEFLWFRGGATVIIDPREGYEQIRFSIIKNTGSATRQKRHAQTAASNYLSPLRALYFGDDEGEPFALLHSDPGGSVGN